MTHVPLGEVRLRRLHHRAALWWLGLLYRKPDRFRDALAGIPTLRAMELTAVLLIHVLPYLLIVTASGRMLLTLFLEPMWLGTDSGAAVLEVAFRNFAVGIAFGAAAGIALGIALGVAGEIAFGIAFGIAGGVALGITVGIGFEITVGIAFGVAFGIAGGVAFGVAFRIAGGIALGIAFGIADEIVGGFAGGFAGEIALSTAFRIAIVIPVVIAATRAYYYPAHLFFVWPVVQGHAYPRHPVAWDDLCSLPFVGLHRLLVAYQGIAPEAADREIERLIDSYPTQRREALKARTILVARAAADERDLARIDQRVASLPDGDQGFLKDTATVRTLVGQIAEMQRRLNAVQRPAFREPLAAQVTQTIETLSHRVGGLHEPLASEFRSAGQHWLAIARAEQDKTTLLVKAQPTRQVFRAGDPVERENEAFIPRYPVIESLDAQLMLATGCPGLLLYGRRRMGKSTLLRNLGGFIDASVVPAYFSMQDPAAFSTQTSFVKRLQAQLTTALPAVAAAPECSLELDGLYRFLGEVEAHLRAQNRRVLLACDEFEMIDQKIGEGVFSPDLLVLVRESVQNHRRIIWLFAGSHRIDELTHAKWPSYFVSLRTIEIPPFRRDETRLLLTKPLEHSPLHGAREDESPRFDPAFWGESGIDFVHDQAGGWPHLVQLLAETAVDLANERGLPLVDKGMLSEVCDRAIVAGDAVLRQLVERECENKAEWQYLLGFRASEQQAPPTNDNVRRALRRRLLAVEEDGLWRLRVPLMRRWLIDRA